MKRRQDEEERRRSEEERARMAPPPAIDRLAVQYTQKCIGLVIVLGGGFEGTVGFIYCLPDRLFNNGFRS